MCSAFTFLCTADFFKLTFMDIIVFVYNKFEDIINKHYYMINNTLWEKAVK